MFSKATANFVREIDPEGLLIHVSRLNDSHKLVPIALVIKRKRWFWQRPKYQPTDFTLSDLLLGDEELTPGVLESDFLTYKGTYGTTLACELGPEVGSASATLKGRGTTKLHSCFGTVKKEEVDVKKLLLDSSNRSVNMQHVLVQQLEKQAEVVALVKERILTTSPCSITQTKVDECIFQGVLGLVGMLVGSSVKVCVKDGNSIEVDSDVSMEIPSGTVISYSILELEIKQNGQYYICLQPGAIGGFKSDSISKSLDSDDSFNRVDGNCRRHKVPQKVPLIALHDELQEKDLSPLAELPQSTRSALFKKLQETLRDRPALSYLQLVLEDLCNGKLSGTTKEEQPSTDSCTESTINAAHLLVSALEELPDETLELLSKSCPDFLQAFSTLVCRLKKSSSNALSSQSLPALLQENQAFQLAEQLLCSAGVKLTRDADRLWMETRDDAGVLPVVLFLSVHGLRLLCNAQEL